MHHPTAWPSRASMQVTHTDPKRAPAIYLAGDSTTSSQSRYGGGWGPGFLDCLGGGAIGANLAYNGATTESFVGGGAWANVIDAVRRSAPTYQTYAMIQVRTFHGSSASQPRAEQV